MTESTSRRGRPYTARCEEEETGPVQGSSLIIRAWTPGPHHRQRPDALQLGDGHRVQLAQLRQPGEYLEAVGEGVVLHLVRALRVERLVLLER